MVYIVASSLWLVSLNFATTNAFTFGPFPVETGQKIEKHGHLTAQLGDLYFTLSTVSTIGFVFSMTTIPNQKGVCQHLKGIAVTAKIVNYSKIKMHD